MINIVRNTVNKDEHYYFGVSMGVDSVSAYFWMLSKGYSVSPIHFNHKLRPQNDLMESKYLELCDATHKIPMVGRGKNLKTESDCRRARLEFVKSVVNFGGTLLTAHHLNDFVESYLLNCFRGQPSNNITSLVSNFPDYKIVHPFLLSRKKDLVQYAERNNLMRFVVVDETNGIIKGSRRNWIRNVIVPEMKKQKLSLEKFCIEKIKEMEKNYSIENETALG
jgi:tRNA(Ile)-lysidine synthase TilS/MesJ